jgi:heat shock protein HtpX
VNLFQQQAANRRRTWLVMAMFIALAIFIGAGLDLYVLGQGGRFIPVGTIAALAIGGGQSYWSLQRGDRAVLLSAGAVPLDEKATAATTDDDRLRYRQYANVVEEMAIAGGVPPPRAYVIPDADPNAFATGRDPQHASIAVTDGLLATLNREELQGVVAHEMAHIRNLDIRLMTVVAALIGMIVLVSDWSLRAMRFGGGRRSGKSKNGGGGALGVLLFAVWLLAVILAPFLAQIMAMAVSRSREYLADATGAQLTRNPLGLASALEKLEHASSATQSIKRGTAHLCIVDPLERRLDNREGRFADLFATHPPMAKRIEALKKMAYERA